MIDEPVTKSQGRRAFLRVVAERDADGAPVRDEQGRVRVRLGGGQGRAAMSSRRSPPPTRSRSSRRPSTSVPAGTDVELWWLDRP